MSSMRTSSMKRTLGTISAFPSSLYSATLVFICSLTSPQISPVSPVKSQKSLCLENITGFGPSNAAPLWQILSRFPGLHQLVELDLNQISLQVIISVTTNN
uniref:Uncharacterized protein n=1 Tax=Lotus japonicus TaxID=34305 RepID=I3SGA4_LOTJA|nr:unknown [Lotus japonicus]